MAAAQAKRIQANCKIIWGADCDYNLEIETDDHVNYTCHVQKDFGDSYGPPLTMTSLCRTSEVAWAELDRMLGLWATQVKRGTPMTKDERLEIFGGPRGEHKKLLNTFMEYEERMGAKPT
ncbi:hypothetical protein A1O3_04768 [Capronia epimyces CBS 606.96]|uniref:Uncharacterized protein n=1 Tax=Capronia epimyces CBS 606.96 TaxID=1182542 RepID=W9Y4E6_9EURO|nr:uncharacterized protein A1O3_04768 [Capronia epimyces CBS 606.96]EXJ84101.1 hypothetical protein A1O3_04768 [Capronia epimyces CBS 606.96]